MANGAAAKKKLDRIKNGGLPPLGKKSSAKKPAKVVNKRPAEPEAPGPSVVIEIPKGALPGRDVVKKSAGEIGRENFRKAREKRIAAGLPANGRVPGQANKVTVLLRDAIPEALSRLGSDGKGKDGLIGWLMKQGQREPVAMMKLLDKLLPMQIQASGQVQHTYGSLEEITERFKSRGLPMPQDFTQPFLPQPDVEVDDGE
jgi:hypothetical protein